MTKMGWKCEVAWRTGDLVCTVVGKTYEAVSDTAEQVARAKAIEAYNTYRPDCTVEDLRFVFRVYEPNKVDITLFGLVDDQVAELDENGYVVVFANGEDVSLV